VDTLLADVALTLTLDGGSVTINGSMVMSP